MLKNALLLVSSIIIAFLMAEGLARLFISAPPRIILLEKDEVLAKRLEDENKSTFYSAGGAGPTLVNTPQGRRNRASVRHRIVGHFLSGLDIDFETNSLGYRNRELSDKSITRALFLGDSIVEAEYLGEPDTFVRKVERLSWQTARPLETINTGVSGISMNSELAILRETGLSAKPDIVVLCFYLNDFNEPFEFKVASLPQWMKKSYFVWLVTKGVNFLMIEQKLRGGLNDTDLPSIQKEISAHLSAQDEAKVKFFEEANTAAMDWGSAWSPSLWQEMTPLFRHFSQLAEDNGFQPVIVAFPVRAQVEASFVEDYPQRRLAEIADELGIPLLDILPALREEHLKSKEPIFYDHCHHTVRGQDIIAREIHKFFQERATIREAVVPPHLLNGAANAI